MNVVMNNGGGFIEVQGTAEGHAFRRDELDELLNLAANGIGQLLALQLEALHADCRRAMRVVLATGDRRQIAGDSASCSRRSRFEVVPQSQFISARPERPDRLRRECADQGATRGAASRLAAIADDSGIEVDALQARPASIPRATPARTPAMRKTCANCLRRCEAKPPRTHGALPLCARVRAWPRDPSPLICQGAGKAASSRRRAAGRLRLRPLLRLPSAASTAAELPLRRRTR